MKLNEMYPSRYLSADDIDGDTPAIIANIKFEKMKDNNGVEQDKPCLYFLRVEKPLVLNKTNAERIASMYGDETDAWAGKKVVLTKEMVTAFGESKWALRIKPTPPPAAGKNAFAAAADAESFEAAEPAPGAA